MSAAWYIAYHQQKSDFGVSGGVAVAGVPMYYNTLVALPMSLSLMKDRLQQRYYRQLEGWLGDVATLEGNATAFCGDDSPVTEAAAGETHQPLPPLP